MSINLIGAFCFGIVIGWVTYRTLRRSQTTGLSDIATVIGAVAGAAITGIWKSETDAFGGYCIGLLIGFFAYLAIAANAVKTGAPEWMGSEPPNAGYGGGGKPGGGNGPFDN
jgi:uncharacterized membrane protein YeaQ/YmgE (transglycosylase-associated protein family)